ncbi:hypothetical protein [Streptomyces flavotricini]|uniref:hypothetical protein n=1 Tax=Streptomyces flavotricini TaxID=66888 RepID=UPI001E41B3EA|nr:hypothetical protein [Streptomyces flavotricini]
MSYTEAVFAPSGPPLRSAYEAPDGENAPSVVKTGPARTAVSVLTRPVCGGSGAWYNCPAAPICLLATYSLPVPGSASRDSASCGPSA